MECLSVWPESQFYKMVTAHSETKRSFLCVSLGTTQSSISRKDALFLLLQCVADTSKL